MSDGGARVLAILRIDNAKDGAADKMKAALCALAGKQVGSVKKAKPVAWADMQPASHVVAVLDGLMLDDIEFLRSQMRDGKITTWLPMAGSENETLAKCGLHIHPLT